MENRNEVQQRFIELRAKGNSYDRIASKLSVSKGTLIEWSKQLSVELGNQISLETDTKLEKYKIAKIHQLEIYGTQLIKIRQEIEKRDLKDVPTPKLVDMQLRLLNAVNNSGKLEVFFKSEGFTLDALTYDWEAQ